MPANGLKDIVCPFCGTRGNWTEPRDFNMMLKTSLGPVEDEHSKNKKGFPRGPALLLK